MDPKVVAAARRLIAGTFVVFNALMALLWFSVDAAARDDDDARLTAILIFWIGANVTLVAAWIAGRWLMARARRGAGER